MRRYFLTMELLIGLILSLVSAAFCYYVAERNNMSKIGWPILGFILPLLGAVATLIVAFIKTKDTV